MTIDWVDTDADKGASIDEFLADKDRVVMLKKAMRGHIRSVGGDPSDSGKWILDALLWTYISTRSWGSIKRLIEQVQSGKVILWRT